MPDRAQAATRISPAAFLLIAVQVALVLAVLLLYRIELERGAVALTGLIMVGFLVHSRLPYAWRTPFFLSLAMLGLAWFLHADALWVIGLGLGMLGLCHLPTAWGVRVLLVTAMGTLLAAIMAGRVSAPWGDLVIPILAAMFMFRIILYLYDLKTDRTPATPWQRMAYFFLLPNISFPLFPIVDYKTFLRGYYARPAAEIYQKGVFWMLRGVLHLLLYRLVYYSLPEVDERLSGVLAVVGHFVLLYGYLLRVSGLFHFVAGVICLFGYDLPPTNHHYYLASGFNDLWRRANIYWKDFMMTVVFYPVLMRVRGWGMTARLVTATAVVFVVTWFLHSYQWFWLRGIFPVAGTDIAFWGALGLAVTLNTVWEARYGRRRRLGRPAWSSRAALSLTLRVVGTFAAMALLWGMWNIGSFTDWGYLLLRARESGAGDWVVVAGGFAAVMAAGLGGQWLQTRGRGLEHWERQVWLRAPAYVVLTSLALLALGYPGVNKRIGGPLETAVHMAQSSRLNRIDREREERGYYETLSRSATLQIPSKGQARPEDWIVFDRSAAARPTTDLRGWEIIPNVVTDFKGVPFRANRWGMRDRDYALAKPRGTYRIALLGGSYDMASAVADSEGYENLLEDRLNRELAGHGYDRYEILNFAVGGYSSLQALYVAEHRVGAFGPDVVLYAVYPGESRRVVERLYQVERQGGRPGPEYEYLTDLMNRAGAHPRLPREEFAHRLEPYQDELMTWIYSRMASSARGRGAQPVFLFLLTTDRRVDAAEHERLLEYVRSAGALSIEVLKAFQGHRQEELQVTEWDSHPSPLGHRLMADAIYQALVRQGERLNLFAPPGADSP